MIKDVWLIATPFGRPVVPESEYHKGKSASILYPGSTIQIFCNRQKILQDILQDKITG
jgi:hypothetical protein